MESSPSKYPKRNRKKIYDSTTMIDPNTIDMRIPYKVKNKTEKPIVLQRKKRKIPSSDSHESNVISSSPGKRSPRKLVLAKHVESSEWREQQMTIHRDICFLQYYLQRHGTTTERDNWTSPIPFPPDHKRFPFLCLILMICTPKTSDTNVMKIMEGAF